MSTYSRADGHSAVAAAAYRARSSYFDERRGRRYTYRSRSGLLWNGLFGWQGTAQDLWNAAERAENRCNARVARELRPALPAELPLNKQVQLVTGFSLWLRDSYGVAVQSVIHAPSFNDDASGKKFWKIVKRSGMRPENLALLFRPHWTNLNFHAHIQITTRKVDPDTGEFGPKTRSLDGRETGPEELKAIRAEWQKRTNALLADIGSSARIDMRSYADQAKAGVAPEGLRVQAHLGPKRHARGRRRIAQGDGDDTHAGLKRKAVHEWNEALWEDWTIRRARERSTARKRDARKFARELEKERKRCARIEAEILKKAKNAKEAETAVAASTQFDSLKGGSALQRAIAAAASERWDCREGASDEFASEVDLETYEPPHPPLPEPVLKVRKERMRGPRTR
ncbi:MobA/MobL family protein [Limimaricola litoreus]|uniref:MobA/MobL family protein n=2 Tax=Limimaricola litoreus TaxID=2955316 RepID=A0A9X2JQM6_9RHOB|nr:MobA/MobL family protein [Limimaricola litoreus]